MNIDSLSFSAGRSCKKHCRFSSCQSAEKLREALGQTPRRPLIRLKRTAICCRQIFVPRPAEGGIGILPYFSDFATHPLPDLPAMVFFSKRPSAQSKGEEKREPPVEISRCRGSGRSGGAAPGIFPVLGAPAPSTVTKDTWDRRGDWAGAPAELERRQVQRT